jgi:hypothetical protein
MTRKHANPPGRTLGTIFDNADVLAHLSAQAARLKRLQAAFEAAAPMALTPSCRVANIKSGKVVILAENGAAALKLKQLAQRIQLELSVVCPEVTEIEIRVQVATPATKATVCRAFSPTLSDAATRGLSPQTAEQLGRFCSNLPRPSPLREAIERLLASTRRSGE